MNSIRLLGISCLLLGLTASVSGTFPTTGGNAQGANCVFPYTYRSVVYRECITTGNGNTPWCATTSNWDTDNQWGNCPSSYTTVDGRACAIPFTYQGTTYRTCTVEDSSIRRLWCSTTTAYSSTTWAYCQTSTSTTRCGTFAMTSNRNYYGGTQNNNGRTVAQCQTLCLNQNDCVAFDWDRVSTVCFIHTDASRLVDSNQGSSQNVDHYRLTVTACDCANPSYDTVNNRGSRGGQQQTSVSTESACRAACNARSETQCYGYDFTTSNQCFLHASADFTNQRYDSTSVTQYVRQPCSGTSGSPIGSGGTGCVNNYQRSENKHAQGGVEQSGVGVQSTCESRCESNSQCVGYDFRRATNSAGNNGACWLHLSENNLNNLLDLSGTDNYRKGACGTGSPTGTGTCVDSFSVTTGTAYRGGQEDRTGTSVELCQNNCRARSDCVGFDFSTAVNYCWLHLDSNNLVSGNSFSNSQVSHHRRLPCGDGTGTGTGDCVDSFSVVSGKGSHGGSQVSSVSTVEACQVNCRGDTNCLAIDFNTNTDRCYKHTDANYDDRRFDDSSVTQYVRNKCEGTGGTGGCVNQYVKIDNQGSYGGELIGGAGSESSCRSACNDRSDCTGFDLTNQCWIFTTAARDRSNYTDSGVDQWNKVECGDTTGSPQPCSDGFTEVANTGSRGGQFESGANTISVCEDRCRDMSDCYGLDFNSRSQCFLHKTQTFTENRYTDSGTTQRVRQDCACTSDSYSSESGKGSTGGSLESGADTVDECKSACNAKSTTECYGFDFNNRNQCYLHSNSNFKSNQFDASDVTQYTRGDCPGECNTYETVSGQGSRGGTADSANSADACKAACTAKSYTECYGVDYSSSTGCYLHANADFTSSSNRYSSSSVTQYVRQPCEECYDTEDDKGSRGGVLESNANTLSLCRSACDAKSETECYGFDFTSDNRCFLHGSSDFTNNRYDSTTVTQYVRKPCVGGTGSVTGVNTGGDGCQDQYTTHVNTNSPGGQDRPSASTFALCLSDCRADAACLAFDFDDSLPGVKCFAHTSSNYLGNAQTRSGNTATQYRLIRTCGTSATSTDTAQETDEPGCIMSSGTFNTRYSAVGAFLGSFNSAADCRTACLRNALCRAAYYNRDSRQCFSYGAAGPTTLNQCCITFTKTCQG